MYNGDMYQITNQATNETEVITEREAIAKYGTDKVNAMMFDMDPDYALTDTDANVELPDCFEGDYL